MNESRKPKRKRHDDDTPRRTPSWTLIAGVFATSLILTGGVVFFAVSALIPSRVTTGAVTMINTNGVRTMQTPQDVSDFAMLSHTGETIRLSDWQGKSVLLFFGYTFCPDVCPVTVADMQQVHEALGAAADEVQFVFVSVDGERDTPARLRLFLEAHDVDGYMVGLSGTPDTLRPLEADFGLYYQLNDPDDDGNYSVDHSSRVYLLDDAGRLTHSFGYGTDPALIAETIQAQ